MNERFCFQEIGIRIMNSATDKGAEIACHAPLNQLATQLIQDGTRRIMDLVLKKRSKQKTKKPPQPTCIREIATANGAKSSR